MDWEQRFWVAWDALCRMEARAERAECRLHQQLGPVATVAVTKPFPPAIK
jgi:hypothetical protein